MNNGPSIEHQQPDNAVMVSDARWELVQRVVASSAFEKSRRLCEFLLFVCERALSEPGKVVHEQEIAREIFGRSNRFDSGQDTVVRVNASQLRKRLREYFSAEGAQEEIVIEIPPGSYMPIFRERDSQPPDMGQLPSVEKTGSRRRAIFWGTLGVILVACSIWLFLENRRLGQRSSSLLGSRPAVDLLWQQIFGNGQHTYVVLADSNLTLFPDLTKTQLSLAEYQRQEFRSLMEARLADPISRDFAYKLMNREFTSITDANLARRIGVLNAVHEIPTDIILARHANPSLFKSHNAILSGPRRSNPWLELFEDQLNFRSRFEENPRLAYFENTAPLPNEQKTYVVKWNQQGYCRVAYLPNLGASGSILIISGTDMASSEAGMEFITSEDRVKHLRSMLRVPDKELFPHFEVLLRSQLIIGAAPTFEVIAHRMLK
jgi:hypothetical protein